MHTTTWISSRAVLLNGVAAMLSLVATAALAGTTLQPVRLNLDAEQERQRAELNRQLKQRAWFHAIARSGQACHPAALILDSDRDPTDVVLRRTRALLRHVQSLPGAPDLERDAAQLESLEVRGRDVKVEDTAARQGIYVEVCRLRRRITLANPELDFDRILFITRHRAGFEHMCDQYYGFYARPGGALLVLEDAFGAAPRVGDLLAGTTVERGRLQGQRLEGGAFVAPELSYDAETILFAYTEAAEEGPAWSPQRSYHIFKVRTDGSGLEQLTDGAWNDFDPCWLPGGRIVFISERRGGYLRCGDRPCPVYTLHSMEPDGRDILCLSYHETHEWHPSVDHDGRVVYTRWDYVDRDTNIAQHPWWTRPDGRDPRPIHGNYPDRRESRPWMEMDIRAVPSSRKFIATAAPHHGQAYGSLVLFDPQVEDDGAMAPVRRFTPDVPFPESEGGKAAIRAGEVYATAWPLSETVALCAYDPGAANHGLYVVDCFGNKELIYRDEAIGSLSPIPLRPRPRPPVLPDGDSRPSQEATVAVINVYESDQPWPQGTRIHALRLVQVLPKTTFCNNKPRIGIGQQTNARGVLGTVPVEADGSAHFIAPAGKALYFQALDEAGLAVQSMRSVTYFQPGQRVTCVGCHEPTHRAPARTGSVPLALRRPPSRIEPALDGARPFNYVQLVQPVLDRHCVACHREKQAVDLAGALRGAHGWTTSYHNLADKFGFYYHVFNGAIDTGPHGGARTIPGRFGARASALLPYLDASHYRVALSHEERQRLVLWLDCNSEFYGAYEDPEAQARGQAITPALD